MSKVETLNTPMRFKVVVLYKKQEITYIFHAVHLQELCELVQDEFPNSKILSVIGGGY